MSDHLVRLNNLLAFARARGWNDSDLARQCGREPTQVHAWRYGIRPIGERLARSLEERLGMPRYALDDRPGTAAVHKVEEAPPQWGVPVQLGQSFNVTARAVPLMTWADVPTMLNLDNADLRRKLPHLDTFAPTSDRAKFVTLPDDSMAPEYNRGDHILLDPTEVPRAGDIVLVVTGSREYFVRQFRPRSATTYDAVALNSMYLPLSSTTDSLEVVAVMVEHRRYRRNV